jgi:hypothetical protein
MINVINDEKLRAQSFKAELELKSKYQSWGHFYAEFSGYGANDYSAKMSLMKQIDDLINELNTIKNGIS